MTGRRWRGASLGLLLLVSACTGDDGGATNLLSYFEQVEQITIDLAEGVDGLPQTTDIEPARVFFSGLNAATESALGALLSLVPPEEARQAHDRWVDLRRQYLALNQRIAEQLDNIATAQEFSALASDEELGIRPQNALADQLAAACRDLQDVADAEGMQVSLRCPPGG